MPLTLTIALLAVLAVAGCAGTTSDLEPVGQTVEKAGLGDYEVVVDWPRPSSAPRW